MASQSTKLSISEREVSNSRSTRRLRREGQVPGVLYGGGEDAVAFAVDERELRHALAARGAVVELELGGDATPAVLKDAQRHPVRGHTMHVDFLRVNLNVAIHSVVALELIGGEDAPGTIEGGVLEHVTREVNIEALPNDIPERLQARRLGDAGQRHALPLRRSTAPAGVTILDDLDETVVATLTPPKLQAELEALDEEAALEQETELVGEGEAPAEDEGDGRGRRRAATTPPTRAPSSASACAGSSARARLRSTGSSSGWATRASATRARPHNVGFAVAEELARRWELPRPKQKYAGLFTDGRTGPGGPRVAVLWPQTYMNEAGNSAGPARGALHLELDRVLVVHDEIDLPFGEVRTRTGGGLAGHNGLKSLRRGLGSPDFVRVRVGVGRPGLDRPRHRLRPRAGTLEGEPGRGAGARRARRRRRRAHRARRRLALAGVLTTGRVHAPHLCARNDW